MTVHRLPRLYQLKFKCVNSQLQENQLNYPFRVKRERCNEGLCVTMKFLVLLVFVFPLNRVGRETRDKTPTKSAWEARRHTYLRGTPPGGYG